MNEQNHDLISGALSSNQLRGETDQNATGTLKEADSNVN